MRIRPGAWKTKEQDAGVGKALLKDELAEIAISNKQNPLLVPGNGKHILIGQTMRIIAGDGGNVMSKLSKVGNQSEVSALVEQEFYRAASDPSPLGGLGKTSCPVTISFA